MHWTNAIEILSLMGIPVLHYTFIISCNHFPFCRCCRSGQECFKPWHYLCSRLTFLVQEVLRYATIDVLEPLWEALEAAMKRATSMDEVGGRADHRDDLGTWWV